MTQDRFISITVSLLWASAIFIVWSLLLMLFLWVAWPLAVFMWRVLSDPLTCLYIGLFGVVTSFLMAWIGGIIWAWNRAIQRRKAERDADHH